MNFEEIRRENLHLISKLDSSLDLKKIGALPLLERTEVRPLGEIAIRATVLAIFKLISVFPDDIDWYIDWLEETDCVAFLSEKELISVQNGRLSSREEIDYSWYQEGINVVMWLLSFKNIDLNSLEELDCAPLMKYLPPENSFKSFKDEASLLSPLLLFSELDKYYLLHWLSKRNKMLNASVIRERRKALEWCLDKNVHSWDDVSLDT